MQDFTLDIYRTLFETLQEKGYEMISYEEYIRDLETSRRRDFEI